MRLLLFSDLHRDVAAAERLVERAAEVDVVVGAGDFATTRRGLSDTLDVLRDIDKPTVVVPGNSESDAELRDGCRDWPAATVLHGEAARLNDVDWYGLGSAVPETPFGEWSCDLSESDAAGLLAGCPAGAVLVVHSPPHGVADVDSRGRHLGSRSIRETIEHVTPRLVVCGHVHASWRTIDRIGDVPVVNAGPEGILWDLEAGRAMV